MVQTYSNLIKITSFLFILTGLSITKTVFGAPPDTGAFVPLVGIPFVEGDKVTTFGDYVNALYFASISIAAFLAVVKIIFAGVKYMLSDVITDKASAKKDIRGALVGLLIVVGAVLILNTINPSLSYINLFNDAPIPLISNGQYSNERGDKCNVTSGCDDVRPECKEGETITHTVGDTGSIVFGCTPIEETDIEPLPTDEEMPENSLTKNIEYLCDKNAHPNGCILRSDFTKISAEGECSNLSSIGDYLLYEDPLRIGWGICYYVP